MTHAGGLRCKVVQGRAAARPASACGGRSTNDAQASLLEDERFTRTPYIGQHGWVTIRRDALKKGELEALVTESWRRVAGKKHLAQLD